jgi:hypothetical protein
MRAIALGIAGALAFADLASAQENARSVQSLECSKHADAQGIHGSQRRNFEAQRFQLPPVKGFWSLTMYNSEYFFVSNPINRYSISARQSLKSNPDGSVDLYIQNVSPGKDKEANWLPAPTGDFILMMRLYWPSTTDPSIIDGSWKVPVVRKVAA